MCSPSSSSPSLPLPSLAAVPAALAPPLPGDFGTLVGDLGLIPLKLNSNFPGLPKVNLWPTIQKCKQFKYEGIPTDLILGVCKI